MLVKFHGSHSLVFWAVANVHYNSQPLYSSDHKERFYGTYLLYHKNHEVHMNLHHNDEGCWWLSPRKIVYVKNSY